MRIFFVTDNKNWFHFLQKWRKDRKEKITIYCSPSGSGIFSNELENGVISVVDVKFSSELLQESYDIGFSCHCKQVFPIKLVSSIPCFNFHPGLNPHNRGWFPQVFSIINGKPIGATLHKMDCEIDHGPIIDQIKAEINSWDTSKSVYDRVFLDELNLFERWIELILKGDHPEKSIDSIGNYNSISDFKRLCEINLDETVTFKDAINFFRAMTYDGYNNAFFYDENGVKIYISVNLNPEF